MDRGNKPPCTTFCISIDYGTATDCCVGLQAWHGDFGILGRGVKQARPLLLLILRGTRARQSGTHIEQHGLRVQNDERPQAGLRSFQERNKYTAEKGIALTYLSKFLAPVSFSHSSRVGSFDPAAFQSQGGLLNPVIYIDQAAYRGEVAEHSARREFLTSCKPYSDTRPCVHQQTVLLMEAWFLRALVIVN